MGKGGYFTGQPVFSQIINLLDKGEIVRISHATKGSEEYVKNLGCFSRDFEFYRTVNLQNPVPLLLAR